MAKKKGGKGPGLKGGRFELKVAKYMNEGGIPAEKQGTLQRTSGFNAPDVLIGPMNECPIWAECKHGIRPHIGGAMAQAQEASAQHHKLTGKHLWCVAITKTNNKEALVTMTLEDFRDILFRAGYGQKEKENGSKETYTGKG